MTPTEINRRIALAIGYAQKDVLVGCTGNVFVCRYNSDGSKSDWLVFNYMDWNTIGPIMERHRMFPSWESHDYKMWTIGKIASRGFMSSVTLNECPRTCAALAVIGAHERGLL